MGDLSPLPFTYLSNHLFASIGAHALCVIIHYYFIYFAVPVVPVLAIENLCFFLCPLSRNLTLVGFLHTGSGRSNACLSVVGRVIIWV